MATSGRVQVRQHLQRCSLNNSEDANHLTAMVREGFELLGAFNWADHLPALKHLDAQKIHQRCAALVRRISAFVQKIITSHRERQIAESPSYKTDFVDVLLNLTSEEKLADEDMIAVLWVNLLSFTFPSQCES